ncbi:MAG: hypothetical protein HYY30_06395 [Chloroflexi bacterium]|nr:hypothetical protein [Chloroflexota bacterium]
MARNIEQQSIEKKTEEPKGPDQQQAQRFALALATPLIKRILLAVLPIRMGPVKEATGIAEAAAGSTESVPERLSTAPLQPAVTEAPSRPRPDPLDFLEGKLPFRVRTDLKLEGDNVVRFDIHQRIQHVLMFTSFLTLAFTGLPQKTHAFGPSQWIIATLGGLEMTQTIHRTAAFVMLFDCLYHAIYIVLGVLFFKKLAPLQIIPNLKDFKDAIQQFGYFLGLNDKPPKFDRFSYLEKFDYWAVFWGIAVIGGSGLILMFPVWATKFLPGQIIPVALVAHSDEAVLAIGWIFVVHFFYAHFVPRIFPFNTSIFTGRVARHRYEEEHTLDWARMMARRQQAQFVAPRRRPIPPRGTHADGAAHVVKIVGVPSGGADLEIQRVPSERVEPTK